MMRVDLDDTHPISFNLTESIIFVTTFPIEKRIIQNTFTTEINKTEHCP